MMKRYPVTFRYGTKLDIPIPRLPFRTFGQRLKILRLTLGLTQREAARLMGFGLHRLVTAQEVYRWERGRVIPSPTTTQAIIRGLELGEFSADWLLGVVQENQRY